MYMLINLLILHVDQHNVFVSWSTTNTVTVHFISWSSTSYIMLINTWNEAIDQQALKTMLINKQLCTVEQHCVLACWSTLFYNSWTIATLPFFPVIFFCQPSVFFISWSSTWYIMVINTQKNTNDQRLVMTLLIKYPLWAVYQLVVMTQLINFVGACNDHHLFFFPRNTWDNGTSAKEVARETPCTWNSTHVKHK